MNSGPTTVNSSGIGLLAAGGPYEGQYFPIHDFPVIIGRKLDNPIALSEDQFVSARHCEISCADGGYWIKDLGSANGTFVNGRRIEAAAAIIPMKSTIGVGKSRLLLLAEKPIQIEESRTLALENLIASGSIMIPNTGFFSRPEAEEALLVVDICNSTRLANEHGEKVLLKVLYAIAKITNRQAEKNEVLFLKCTGDGFFAAFRDTQQALRVAGGLLLDLERLRAKVPQLPPVGLRIAIHRGPISIDKNGDRLGIACHLVFRLEGAKLENRVSSPDPPCELPEQNRILLTDAAIQSLGEEFSGCFTYLGEFIFKGFETSPVRVNLLMKFK